jgi:hypothetical protein
VYDVDFLLLGMSLKDSDSSPLSLMSTRMTKNKKNETTSLLACDAVEVEENEYDEIKKYLHSAREIR